MPMRQGRWRLLAIALAAACGSPGASSSSSDGHSEGGDGSAQNGDASGTGDGDSPGDDARTDSPTDGAMGATDGGSLAAAHCGDQGIENDPDVVFVEKFDEGSIMAASARWDPNPDNPQAMSIVQGMAPAGSKAGVSSKWHYESTTAFTVGFVKTFTPGYEQLWFRYYVNIAAAGDPIWHFFRLGGGSPFGGANVKPDGTDRFATAVEPNYTRQKWDFYTYWMDMRADSAGNFYGNNFLGEDFGSCKDLAPPVATGQWLEVEMMVKVNAVGAEDGEQAFWIEGEPVTSSYAGNGAAQIISDVGPGKPRGSWVTAHYCPDTTQQAFSGDPANAGSGFRWRTVPALTLSYIRPIVYNDQSQPNPANDVYVANIVVAKRPIGPIVPCP
jgi:hypothetical protein